MEVRTLDLEPGSPWEKCPIERCNRRLRDELLDGELFYALWEAQMVIERLRQAYNGVSPHSALGSTGLRPQRQSSHDRCALD